MTLRFNKIKGLFLNRVIFAPIIIRFLSVFVGFFLSVLIARILGKEIFGVFVFLITIALFISILSSFGLGRVALRLFNSEASLNCSNYRAKLFRRFLITWLFISGIIFVVLLFFYFISSYFMLFEYFSFRVEWVITIIAISYGLLIGWRIIAVDIFISNKRPLDAVLIDGFASNCILIITLFVLNSLYPNTLVLLHIISLHVLAVILVQLCGIIRLHVILQSPRKKQGDNSIIPISKMSLVLQARFAFYHRLGMSLSSYADVWLLGAFSTISFVADYGVSFKIATFVSFLLASLNGIIPPYFGDFIRNNEKVQLERFCRSFSTVVAIPSIILALILFVYGGELVSLMFGMSFESAGEVLKVLVIMHVANVLSGPCGIMLVMYGMNKELMKIMISTSLITIIIATIFAFKMETGIAIVWCFVIGSVVRQFLLWLYVKEKCGINTAPSCNFTMLKSEFSRFY